MESNADTEILTLWQQQAREEQMMPLDEIRTKAEQLDAKTRRWRVVTAVLFILLVSGNPGRCGYNRRRWKGPAIC